MDLWQPDETFHDLDTNYTELSPPSLASMHIGGGSSTEIWFPESPTLSWLAVSGILTPPACELVHLFLQSRKSRGRLDSMVDGHHFLQQRWESGVKHTFSHFELILINHLSLLATEHNQTRVLGHDIDFWAKKLRTLLSFAPNTDPEVINCYIWIVVGSVGSPRVQRGATDLSRILKSRILERYPVSGDWAALEPVLRQVYWDDDLAVNWRKYWM